MILWILRNVISSVHAFYMIISRSFHYLGLYIEELHMPIFDLAQTCHIHVVAYTCVGSL